MNHNKALVLTTSALLLFCAATTSLADRTQLARELYEDGDWTAARSEARRVLQQEPDHPTALMIVHLSGLQTVGFTPDNVASIQQFIAEITDPRVRAETAYTYGHMLWARGDIAGALHYLRMAFSGAPDHRQFLKAAYSLDLLTWRNRGLIDDADPLWTQLRTARPLITPAIRQEVTPPPRPRNNPAKWPALKLVRFYQTQIGPAIGQRCSMHPSCSTYCVQAVQAYGLVGIPMTGDRLIRESDHVNHRLNPVWIDGQEKYVDPVTDHSFWFRRYRK